MANWKEQAISTEDVDISGGDHTPENPASPDESRNSGPILYVGTGGNVKVTTQGGTVATFNNVPDGAWLPVQVRLVWQTGTTASNMILCW